MSITEIAPDVFRLSLFIPEANLQFNQFLVRDEEPLLFHTGMRAIFPMVREAVAQLIDPSTLRHISFSHFEADECGSLNEWLEIAPNAQAMQFCGSRSQRQRFRFATREKPCRRRDVLDRQIQLPFPAHSASSALLGSRTVVRGN